MSNADIVVMITGTYNAIMFGLFSSKSSLMILQSIVRMSIDI